MKKFLSFLIVCATICTLPAMADYYNFQAAGGGGGGAVSSVAALDSTVTVSPTTGAVKVSLPIVNSNVGTFTLTTLTIDAQGRITAASSGSAGSGTVTSFSAGTLSPLFTTSVATATSTPALTFALSNAAAHTWFGNNTGSSAAPGFKTSTQLTADLDLFSSTLQGLTPFSGGGTTNFLRADGTWAVPPGTGSGTPGGTSGQVQYNNSGAFGGFTASGDATINTGTGAIAVTKTGGVSFAASATTDTTNAANISSGTLPAARIPNFGTSVNGGVPASGGGTSNFLRADGSWAAPGGGGGGGFTASNQTTSFSAVAQNAYFVDTTGGAVVCTLPTAVSIGGNEIEVIHTAGSNALSFNTTSSQTISGQASGAISSTVIYNGYRFMADGANWFQE